MKLTINLSERSYDILLQRGGLANLGEYVNLKRKVLIVSDNGVPLSYLKKVQAQCSQGILAVVEQGEQAKSMEVFTHLLTKCQEHHFTRSDLILAVGGGVMGDLAGFVASAYLRGMDFVNCPTTTLSQIDSSIGGKVGINFNGTKNIVGAFHQPKFVLIDPDTLNTLSDRHFAAGLAEAVKAGMIADPALFTLFEEETISKTSPNLEKILFASLQMKKSFVEADEKELGIRAALNFGHTIGHGIESYGHLQELYHGECVALGMIPMTENETLRRRLLLIYEKLGLPTSISYDGDAVYQAMTYDKKNKGNTTKIVKVKTLGTYHFQRVETASLRSMVGGGIS
ncbi:MAG: 3-dehydroquinate synthase [Eubacteriales bacterium]